MLSPKKIVEIAIIENWLSPRDKKIMSMKYGIGRAPENLNVISQETKLGMMKIHYLTQNILEDIRLKIYN